MGSESALTATASQQKKGGGDIFPSFFFFWGFLFCSRKAAKKRWPNKVLLFCSLVTLFGEQRGKRGKGSGNGNIYLDGNFQKSRKTDFSKHNTEHSYLVDPASSHMLVSKIKPCMSKYKQIVQRNCEWLIKSVIIYLIVPSATG